MTKLTLEYSYGARRACCSNRLVASLSSFLPSAELFLPPSLLLPLEFKSFEPLRLALVVRVRSGLKSLLPSMLVTAFLLAALLFVARKSECAPLEGDCWLDAPPPCLFYLLELVEASL